MLPGGEGGQRMFGGAWVRDDSNERTKYLPWQSHPARSVQDRGQPGSRGRVERALLVHRVEEQVRVYQHQRAVGPSSRSRASATLSTSIRSPTGSDRCRNFVGGRLDVSPARMRSLTTSLSLAERAWRNCPTARAT